MSSKKGGETKAEPLIKVPKSNCLGESKARRGCDIWTSNTTLHWEMCSLTKDKTTPVSKETGQLASADWINIALDWPVAVYFLRANQRHLANLGCKDPVSLLYLFPCTHYFCTHTIKPVNQTSLSLSLFLLFLPLPLYPSVISGGLSEHHWVKLYLTHQVSQWNDPDAHYNPDQQLLSAPPGPAHWFSWCQPIIERTFITL